MPCDGAHARPHAPQLVTLVAVSASHPFEGSPSQFVKPAVHAPSTHTPVEHVALAFANAHAWPHAPQLARSDRTIASHPLATSPSQSAVPGMHVSAQAPAVQVAVPPAPAGHTCPHEPQFAGSVWVATQRVPQMVG